MYSLEVIQRLLGMPQRLDGADSAEVPDLNGVEYDSRKVVAGQIFVCIPGLKTDGREFALSAIQNGARALVVEQPISQCTVPQLVVSNARQALAILSAHFAGRPAQHMTVVGITGTNGKTTTSYFCEAVLKSIQRDCGVIGTIQAVVGGQSRSIANTTPESLLLHQLLSEMRSYGQDSVVMEVSSHSLDLHRVHQLPVDVAVFTNLTHDHLDPADEVVLVGRNVELDDDKLGFIASMTLNPQKARVLLRLFARGRVHAGTALLARHRHAAHRLRGDRSRP